MNKMKMIPAAILMSTVALTGNAMAHEGKSNFHADNNFVGDCNINLHQGVTVTPSYVKVFDKHHTLYQISKNGEMTIDGKTVSLDSTQQQTAAQYAEGIRSSVPKAVAIATDAIELASKGVGEAMGTLFGENSDIQIRIEDVMAKAKEKVNESLSRSGDEFTISPDGFDDMDNIIDEELEQEIEKVVMSSMGSIFSLIGQAMSEGDGDFEQRMEAFGEKMEKWGEELEASLEAQADDIEEKAEALCQQLKEVDELETKLQSQVPEFAKFDLLEVDRNRHAYHHDED